MTLITQCGSTGWSLAPLFAHIKKHFLRWYSYSGACASTHTNTCTRARLISNDQYNDIYHYYLGQHTIFFFLSHMLKIMPPTCPTNAHADVTSGARRHHLHPYFVYASRKGSGALAHCASAPEVLLLDDVSRTKISQRLARKHEEAISCTDIHSCSYEAKKRSYHN